MGDRNVIAIAWDWVKPSGWDFATYTGEAQAPVLYKYDSSGFISAAPNRNITIQDGTYINEYNQRVATRLQEQDTTLNQLLQQTMPNWQPVAKDLNFLSNPTANYSNEGRNYQTPTYNFGPNYRGNGFTDPRLLDNSGGYRGLNTYSGVYASQAAENAAFEQDWNTALNAYSTQPSYTSFPTDPAAYNGYADAFGETPTNNSVHDFWSPSSASPPSIAPSASTSNYSPPAYGDEGGWSVSGMLSGAFAFAVSFSWVFPLVVDLDDDGVEIKPLDRSTTYFDFDGDGYKERTAWVGADDGMLVIDLNGDGQVTQSKEMALGEWTSEQDTDLQALGKVFDSNKDGTALDLSDGTSIAGLFKVQRTNGKIVEEANDSLFRRCA